LSSQDEQRLPSAGVHTFEIQPIEAIIISYEATDNSKKDRVTTTDNAFSKSTGTPPLAPLTANDSILSSLPSMVLPVPDLQLPPYITPFPDALEPEVQYLLHRRGAVSLPRGDFRESLLRAYICHVHPFLPLLDLEDFISTIENEDGSRTVSLVLFQAVMFAASTFVDTNDLEKEGFKSHKDIRETFFNKVRVSCLNIVE
jgi:hypothetical protein